MVRLFRSPSSLAGTPSAAAATRVGVPCSTGPETISPACPALLLLPEKTTEGTPKAATSPMWRGPLAYVQAAADRTVLMEAESTECVRAVQDRRCEPTDIPVTSARPRGLTPQLSPERAPAPTGLGSASTGSV